jgi:hypothetical protein
MTPEQAYSPAAAPPLGSLNPGKGSTYRRGNLFTTGAGSELAHLGARLISAEPTLCHLGGIRRCDADVVRLPLPGRT